MSDFPLQLSLNSLHCSKCRLSESDSASESESESESELLYDGRFTANQFVLATSPLRPTASNFIFQLNTCGYSPHVTSSLTREWVCRLKLLLALASAVILRSDSRLPQLRGPGPLIYIPQEQGGPFISPVTGFPFRRLLRLAGLLWRYSTPPPHGF
jgi:hypothetical protein